MRRDTAAHEPFLEGERVHDGREHAHMVAGDAVAALAGDRHAAEDVAAAGDERHAHAECQRLADLAGDAIDHLFVNAELLIAEKRLAGKLEENLPVARLRHRRSIRSGA
jgi:hypothetical protein